MDKHVVYWLAQISAINARVEGMKALNDERKLNGYTPAYDAHAFEMEAQNLERCGREVMGL